MQYKQLGKTDLLISTIGFGTWGFANDPDSWVGATKTESENALLTALDHGVNFIDTARIYGNGLAEEWLGEILKNNTHQPIIIASKIPPLNQEWSGMKGVSIQQAFPRQHIIDQVNQSLHALHREYLDLMYFHVWEDEWVNEPEWQETITSLTQAGKVKYWGVSTNDYEPTNGLAACKTGKISVLMTIFNLFYQEPIQTLFTQAEQEGIGIVARVPLDEGGLTGKFSPNTQFPDGDFRQTYFSPSRLIELEQHIQQFLPFIDGEDIETLPELALRFILSYPQISSTIPGMRNPSHAISNTVVADLPPLKSEMLAKLQQRAWNRNFYNEA